MHFARKIGLSSAIAVALAAIFVIYERAPPYTFNPFCTYDLTYRLNVTIEADGKQYSSEVVHQLSRSRKWIEVMNYNGCPQVYGTALAFRLEDRRLALLSSQICPKAERVFGSRTKSSYRAEFARAMSEHRKLDATPLCAGVSRDFGKSAVVGSEYDGFLIDNADQPTRWSRFRLDNDSSYPGAQLRIVSVIVEAADVSPEDDLDNIAPAILKTQFKYDQWFDSPEHILSFSRRYYPDRKFSYIAEQH